MPFPSFTQDRKRNKKEIQMQIMKLHTHTHLPPAQKRMVEPGKDGQKSKEKIENRTLIFKRQQNNNNNNYI